VNYTNGCEVILVKEGRVITSYRLDLPAGMLVEQIRNGKWRFRRFGQEGNLTAVQVGERVYVHAGKIKLVSNENNQKATPRSNTSAQASAGLSLRQRQVLAGLASGQTLAEIAFHLGIRVRSVRHHVDALKLKLRAVSLSQLVARAMVENRLECTPPQGGTGAGRRSDHPKKH
jgi:DNA-binding CsgD family transcriptional regulator